MLPVTAMSKLRARRKKRADEAIRVVAAIGLAVVALIVLLIYWLHTGNAGKQLQPAGSSFAHVATPSVATAPSKQNLALECDGVAKHATARPHPPSELAKPLELRAGYVGHVPNNDAILSCLLRRSMSWTNQILHDFREDSLTFVHSVEGGTAAGSLNTARETILETFERRSGGGPHQYHGQGHEGGLDRFVAEVLLPGKCNGRFFEMGANDGSTGSNTHHFEYRRNWTGVLVEANTGEYEKARAARPNAKLHNVAVADTPGFLVKMKGWGATTVTQCAAQPATAAHVEAELQRQAKTGLEHPHPTEQDGKLGVACIRIDTLLQGEGGFDFVMLDCEGCEDTAVRNWDFEANPVGILTIEIDQTPEMKAKLAAAHMVYLGKIIDHIWVQPRYIYEQNAKLFSPSGSCI